MGWLGGTSRQWTALAVVVGALAAGAQPALFSPAKEVTGLPVRPVAADMPLPPRQEAVDVRVAQSDLGLLDSTRTALESGLPARLSLNLTAAAAFDVTFERWERTLSGYALSGRVAGEPLSGVTVAVGEGRAYGSAWMSGASYVIEQFGPSASIRQAEQAALGRCGGVLQAPVLEAGLRPPTLASGAGAEATEDDGSIIDVIVFYTQKARREAGGHRAIRTLVDHHAAWTNDAYAVGGAVQRIRVVATAQVDYEGDDLLALLRRKDDGHMDDVHTLRDAYAADLVLLMTSGGGGWAYRSMREEWSFATAGIAHPKTFAHELGHLMGLAHQRENDNSNWPFPYSHGYELRDDRGLAIISTIMHQSGWTGRFSNPRQTYRGHRLGVPGDEPTLSVDGPADAVRSLNGTRRVVANFRASTARCTYTVSPADAAVPAGGGEFSFVVDAAPDCAWEARSADAAVSVLAGAGTGPGEATYRVSPHEGWPRELAVFAAGELHSIEQAGMRELSSSPCERSPAVRGAVSAALGKPCEDVHAADLARLGALDLGRAPANLAPGDFDGLAHLDTLTLNPAEGTLAPGIFHGLPRLRKLAIFGPRRATNGDYPEGAATRLAPGAFDGLSSLEELSYFDTPLANVAPGAFDGLLRLSRLSLRLNELEALEAGVFDGLPALRSLDLIYNRLAALPPNVFNGLSKLETLYLDCNRFEAFEPGTFRGLSSLVFLSVGRQDHFSSALHPDLFLGLRSLDFLGLRNMGLKGIPSGLFRGSSHLLQLSLGNFDYGSNSRCGNNLNRLALQAGAFRDLSALRQLDLQNAGLRDLAPGTFAGLDSLDYLQLQDNALAALRPGVLGHLDLEWLFLGGNELRTLPEDLSAGAELLYSLRLYGNRLESLPPNAFVGLGSNGGFWTQLTLHGNPGAPFDIEVQLVQLPASPGHPAQVALRVREGAPINMEIALKATGGLLSVDAAYIGQGDVQGAAVSVLPAGNGPMVVALGDPPAIPGDPECGARVESMTLRLHTFDLCHTGYRIVTGAPLTLYGFVDQTLSPSGAAVRLSLANVFLPLFASGGLAYEVELDGPAVTARAEGGELVLVPAAARGKARVTVTATDGRRTLTRSFMVTVGEPPVIAAPLPGIALESGGEPFEALLAQAFSAPTGATLTFSAISDAPELATASVVGATLSVVPNDAGREGQLTVAVTAIDELGLSATQHVEVTVSSSSRPFLRGWRLTLPRGE